jgi:hypothetical protein
MGEAAAAVGDGDAASGNCFVAVIVGDVSARVDVRVTAMVARAGATPLLGSVSSQASDNSAATSRRPRLRNLILDGPRRALDRPVLSQ